MSNSVIGSLRVILGADTAAFETNMKKSQATLSKTAGQWAKIGATMAVSFAGMTATLVKSSLNAADAMLKSSQRAGVAFGAFQQLDYAAALAGVSTAQLETSMAMLNKKMGETAANATAALGKLGMSVRDSKGAMRDSVSVLDEIADRYKAAGSEAQKMRILTEAFGRSGAQLAPMLKDGSEGLRKVREEASRLGLVLDQDLAQKAEVFNDQMATFSKVIRMNFQGGILKGFLGDAKDLRAVFTDPAFVKGIREAGIALGTFAAFAVRNSREIVAVSAGIATMFLATRVGAKGVVTVLGGLGAALATYIAMGKSGTDTTQGLSEALNAARNAMGGYGDIVSEQANKLRLSTEELNRSRADWEKLTSVLHLGEEAHRRMADALELINRAREVGAKAGTPEGERWMAAAIAAKQAERQYQEVGKQLADMEALGGRVGDTLEDAFVSATAGGQKLDQVARNLVSSFARLAAQMAFRSLLGSLIPGGDAPGGFLKGLIGKADGGMIRGPGTGRSDSIPAWLSNGEYVVNAEATKKWGGLLAAINSGAALKFASGGMVGLSPIPENGPEVMFNVRGTV